MHKVNCSSTIRINKRGYRVLGKQISVLERSLKQAESDLREINSTKRRGGSFLKSEIIAHITSLRADLRYRRKALKVDFLS